MNVFEIALTYQDLLEEIENGSLNEEEMKDTIESLKDMMDDVLKNTANSYKNDLAFANALEEEAKELKEKAMYAKKAAERKMNFMDALMKAGNLNQIQVGTHMLKYRKGSEVVEINENEIPSFREAPVLYNRIPEQRVLIGKPDLKKRLQKGEKIPGISLVRRPDSLAVK